MCGGVVPEWARLRCDTGLVCADFPPFIPDAPGLCRRPCSDDEDLRCDPILCHAGRVSRRRRLSPATPTATMPSNDYPRDPCAGYGNCEADLTCLYYCGDLACRDLSGENFGFC